MKLKSPAKINLNLKITGRREDGYHFLDSIFLPINLYDEIEIIENAHDHVQFIFPTVTKKLKNNTVEKVLNHLRDEGFKFPFLKINVTKNIPIGAGLGGGSSNAATVLKYINEKYLKLSAQDLINIAAHIGADVPFFVVQKSARITGIGEKIEVLKSITPLNLVICKPPFSVSTKEAYEWYDAQTQLTAPHSNASNMNDLEAVVMQKRPKIADIKKALTDAGAKTSLMTGSGSAVFGIFEDKESAAKALAKLKAQFDLKHSFYLVKSLE